MCGIATAGNVVMQFVCVRACVGSCATRPPRKRNSRCRRIITITIMASLRSKRPRRRAVCRRRRRPPSSARRRLQPLATRSAASWASRCRRSPPCLCRRPGRSLSVRPRPPAPIDSPPAQPPPVNESATTVAVRLNIQSLFTIKW